MRFKVGDKVRFKNDVYIIEETAHYYGLNHYWFNHDWYEEDELELVTDQLAQKVLERNNKYTGGLTDDKVNSPSHYTRGDIEVIDIIKQLTQGYEPFEAYLVGNTIKYLARANFKENKQQDLEKAGWHISKLLKEQNK